MLVEQIKNVLRNPLIIIIKHFTKKICLEIFISGDPFNLFYRKFERIIFSDASGYAGAGFALENNNVVHFMWDMENISGDPFNL
jgi:hypothetical protein